MHAMRLNCNGQAAAVWEQTAIVAVEPLDTFGTAVRVCCPAPSANERAHVERLSKFVNRTLHDRCRPSRTTEHSSENTWGREVRKQHQQHACRLGAGTTGALRPTSCSHSRTEQTKCGRGVARVQCDCGRPLPHRSSLSMR